MIKSISICLTLITGLCVLQAQDEMSVRMDLPSEVTAGEEFLVSVDIEKGSLEEFSRFQQELPAGLTAIQDNSGAADFTFEEQRVRFIWLKLPPEEKLAISYKVKVNERLKGSLNLFGEFSYVENNERRSILIDEAAVRIIPSPDIPADQQVDIAQFAAVLASEKAAMSSAIDISCIRQTPYPSRTGNDILVNLLVYKKEMNKFAKIEEQIPDGFEAASMESRDGLFTFKDGIAKFVWMNLPAVPGFKISYRLIPQAGQTAGEVSINGTLSYIHEGRNIEVDIIQQDIDLAGVNDENIEAVVAAIEKGETVSVSPPPKTQAVKPPPDKTPDIKEDVRETPPAREAGTSNIPSGQLLPVYDGVYFRVQLAATRRLRDANEAFGNFRLSKPVLIERHNSMYKYSVGSFPNYTQAQQYRNTAVSRGIKGAFIVAYRNGKRIDMMDAVQATGGK
jgi:ribosomal protein L12E/L44/L45/RPP1/RPP2